MALVIWMGNLVFNTTPWSALFLVLTPWYVCACLVRWELSTLGRIFLYGDSTIENYTQVFAVCKSQQRHPTSVHNSEDVLHLLFLSGINISSYRRLSPIHIHHLLEWFWCRLYSSSKSLLFISARFYSCTEAQLGKRSDFPKERIHWDIPNKYCAELEIIRNNKQNVPYLLR